MRGGRREDSGGDVRGMVKCDIHGGCRRESGREKRRRMKGRTEGEGDIRTVFVSPVDAVGESSEIEEVENVINAVDKTYPKQKLPQGPRADIAPCLVNSL